MKNEVYLQENKFGIEEKYYRVKKKSCLSCLSSMMMWSFVLKTFFFWKKVDDV